MADSDCQRLSCVQCTRLFDPARKLDGGLRSRQPATCGRKCASQRIRVAKGAILVHDYRACLVCGDRYRPRRASAMYCSKACKSKAFDNRRLRDVRAAKAAAIKEREARAAAAKVHLAEAKQERIAERVRQQRAIAGRTCTWCTVSFSSLGTAMRYCGIACAKAYAKDARRADKIARKALERAARVETVSPRKVFDRDGWQCYLCGCATPSLLRGTYEHNAPELEHVVPLSKGGEHSYANLRCACRACNLAKGDHDLDELGGPYPTGGRGKDFCPA